MKKVITTIAATALCVATAFSLTACNTQQPSGGDDQPTKYSVYAPDGAPALALTNLIAGHDTSLAEGYDFDVHVVDANTILTYVTGENPTADFCILPVNEASLKLGSGETYQMLGTVTNGNLYFLTTGENGPLAKENFATALIGKKVGVVQLARVPGLTLQATLADYEIPYQVLASAQEDGAEDKVNLIAFTPDNVTPAGGCDYYLCPEPAASTKIKGTSSTAKPFVLAGDLQELYGEGGYPQAVMVAKKSVIEQHAQAVGEVIEYLTASAAYLADAEPATLIDLLANKRTEGLAPSFNANNLTKEVVAHCSVGFTPSVTCKDTVNAFLTKLIAVNETAAKSVSDAFYYMN